MMVTLRPLHLRTSMVTLQLEWKVGQFFKCLCFVLQKHHQLTFFLNNFILNLSFATTNQGLNLYEADKEIKAKLKKLKELATDNNARNIEICAEVLNSLFTACNPDVATCTNQNTQSFVVSTEQMCAAVTTHTILSFDVIGDEFDGFSDNLSPCEDLRFLILQSCLCKCLTVLCCAVSYCSSFLWLLELFCLLPFCCRVRTSLSKPGCNCISAGQFNAEDINNCYPY